MGKIATREAYGHTLAKLICENENIVVLDADLTKSTKTNEAKKSCPERHFNIGIAEANMMSIAAGLAASGKIVYASSFAMFATGRAFEQVRNSICYPNLNVKICATHAGITLGEDGASHQSVEDIALMRVVPNMQVIQPCDGKETEEVIRAVANIQGPVYVRLGRSSVDDVHDDTYQFHFGKGEVLRTGKDVAIFATGLMVQESLKAAEELKQEGIDCAVINMATIKPIDKELIVEMAKTHQYLVSCEEHSIMAGFGSAIAEVLVSEYPARLEMIGLNDTFGESGKPRELLEKYGLGSDSIIKRIKAIVK